MSGWGLHSAHDCANEENGHGKGMVGKEDEESFFVCMAIMERLSHDIALKNGLFTHASRRVNRSPKL